MTHSFCQASHEVRMPRAMLSIVHTVELLLYLQRLLLFLACLPKP